MRERRALSSAEIQKCALGILTEFDRVCKKMKLRYSIAYGTLLGAVRHQGFIPWDDDIDVIMPRPDFEKLTMFSQKEFGKRYRFVSIDTDKKFMAPLAKIIDMDTELYENSHVCKMVLGVYVDIFVYDGISDNRRKRKRAYRRANLLQRGWCFGECVPNRKTPYILVPVRRICNKTYLARCFSKYMNYCAKKNSFNTNRYMSNIMFGFFCRDKDTYEIKEFDNLTDYRFENIEVKGFGNYDLFLNKWYGTYMQLPPEEKRVSNHDFRAYWRNNCQ